MKLTKSTLKRLIKEVMQEATREDVEIAKLKLKALELARDERKAIQQAKKDAERSAKVGAKFDAIDQRAEKVKDAINQRTINQIQKTSKIAPLKPGVGAKTLAEQTDPRAALIGAVDAALSEIDMDPDLRMKIAKTLGDSVADKFFFGFEARQKD
jgi:hypothetical protein